ncbi:MAG: hypothetical protein Q7S74_05255 [Nanoarchaeota archaeon]|nr:hypothetical protein [Nanoarchaeota archaeon]
MRIISHKEVPFPDDLEGRLNVVLNIVNTEFKMITLLHLNNIPTNESEIRAKVKRTVGKSTYLPLKKSFRNYCCNTLFSTGTVAEEEIIKDEDKNSYFGYCLTTAGKDYGLPISAFSLNYVVQNQKSMFKILRKTSPKGETRAPLNIIKTLEALKSGNKKSIVDLEKITSINRVTILNSIRSLSSIGFLQYESIGETRKGEGYITYEWISKKSPNEVKPIISNSHLTKDISQLLHQRGSVTGAEVKKALGLLKRKDISMVLSELVKQEFARRKRWKGGEEQSEVNILEKGRNFLTNFVEPIKEALGDGPALQEMQKFHNLFVNSQSFREYTISAINLYKSISPILNGKTKEERFQQILDYLKCNPGSRPSEVAKDLSYKMISLYLTQLVKTEAIRKEKIGKKVRYYINQ